MRAHRDAAPFVPGDRVQHRLSGWTAEVLRYVYTGRSSGGYYKVRWDANGEVSRVTAALVAEANEKNESTS